MFITFVNAQHVVIMRKKYGQSTTKQCLIVFGTFSSRLTDILTSAYDFGNRLKNAEQVPRVGYFVSDMASSHSSQARIATITSKPGMKARKAYMRSATLRIVRSHNISKTAKRSDTNEKAKLAHIIR